MTGVGLRAGIDLSHQAIRDLVPAFEGIANPAYVGSSGSTAQPVMPAADMALFHDDFADGRLHGWRGAHMGSTGPESPTSVETDYPFPGLFLATGDTPYRAGAAANGMSTYKGLSARFPVTGILSFSGLFAVSSAGAATTSWTNWGMTLDLQNYDDSLRATPFWICQAVAWPGRAQMQIIDDSGTYHNITGQTNPVSGSTISTTGYLFAGENESKWDVNYVRVSYDLGNLFTASSGLTSRYYEVNINGHRIDLRTQGFGRGSWVGPQSFSSLGSFGAGLNAGIILNRTSTANAAARLVAGDLKLSYHKSGWLV